MNATPSPLETLTAMREFGGARKTVGLSDEVIARFLAADPELGRAINEAWENHQELQADRADELKMDEADLVVHLQQDFVNFYGAAAVNPYVALAARGPWIVTAHGAVLHDNGGYGMLGLGHGPDAVIDALEEPWVIANIMTPSFSQKRFGEAMRAECGHARTDGCPFHQFICMNSGSESVTVAARISDINAAQLTGPGGRHEGKAIKMLAIHGGFHGRTDRPAQASHSTSKTYRKHLASFRGRDNLVTVPPNDIAALREAFAQAERDGVFFEMMLAEPVMGEGNPGMAMTREFYDEARRLTRENGTLFLIDAIQAGLRATGDLSIVDFPGFEDCECPDLETWSKALNAAQYPLSVLGLNEHTAAIYQRGVYGNTMTTNPRALEVAIATLAHINDDLRQNIRDRGVEFVQKLEGLMTEFPGCVTQVQGTGLLLSAELDPERFPVVGFGGVEEYMRCRGIGVIHGGQNALRFTPHFYLTSAEIDLVIEVTREAIAHFAKA